MLSFLLAALGWVQDRFVISFWVDPIVPPAEFDARYAEIAAAHFNVLLGGFGARDRNTVQAQLDAAARHNLVAIPSSCGGGKASASGSGLVEPGACVNLTSPALLGWQLSDEPAASSFAHLAAWTDAVAIASPSALRFINLLPNYATPAQLNASDYDAYVREYVRTVRPDVLCTDAYPFFEGPAAEEDRNTSKAGYVRNVRTLRDVARTSDPPLPWWNFFNAFAFGGHRDPTEAELR